MNEHTEDLYFEVLFDEIDIKMNGILTFES